MKLQRKHLTTNNALDYRERTPESFRGALVFTGTGYRTATEEETKEMAKRWNEDAKRLAQESAGF